MEVIRLTNHPSVDVRALKDCLENDPALTTKILRVVNSSLFGMSRQVSDLNQALALLGIKPLKLLVLGFSLPDTLFAGLAGDVLSRYWQTTLIRAVAARELSRLLWETDGDEAFIAALLQDLGMLVLIQQLGEPYVEFLNQVHTHQGDLSALESEVLGFTHTELTVRLLDKWGLPKRIVEAIRANDLSSSTDPSCKASGEIAHVLYLAKLLSELMTGARDDVLAELLGTDESGEGCDRQLTTEQLESLVPTLQEKVEQLADVLAVSLPTTEEYAALLADAHGQLAEIATDAAIDVVRADRANNASIDIEETLLAHANSLTQAVARFAAGPAENEGPEVTNSTRNSHYEANTPETEIRLHGRQAGSIPRAKQTLDPGLKGRLAAAVANARQSRSELSLLLAELDNYGDLIFCQGGTSGDKLVALLAGACRSIDHPVAHAMAASEGQYAVVLSDCDRRQAVELADELLQAIRRLSDQLGDGAEPRLSISVGVASVGVPPKNFPPADLIEAAERCLYGAQSSGGNSLKSIGIL